MTALERVRVRSPRLVIGAAFLFALLFAVGIETVASHDHDGVTGSRQCAVCRVAVHAPGDAPELSDLLSSTLSEGRGEPLTAVSVGPAARPLLDLRLRAPPTA